MIQKTPVLHKSMSTHSENGLLYIFAFFLRHERWCTDGTYSEKHHVVWTRPTQGHHVKQTRSKSEQVSGHGPGAPTVRRWCHVPSKRTKLMVSRSRCFQLFASTVSTSYSRFFFTNSSNFGFYILLLLFSFLRRVWMLFKEYGCSKTERIQKWPGGLSNALLRVHYKDE